MRIEIETWDLDKMSKKLDGLFSANLFSLQLQIKTLLEEAGGDHALTLLDSLCTLSKSEQKVALGIFQRCISKFAESGEHLVTAEDAELQQFEENLYNDIVNAMHEASTDAPASTPTRKFEVLDGGKQKLGKQVQRSSTIDFNKARKNKRPHLSPVLN